MVYKSLCCRNVCHEESKLLSVYAVDGEGCKDAATAAEAEKMGPPWLEQKICARNGRVLPMREHFQKTIDPPTP